MKLSRIYTALLLLLYPAGIISARLTQFLSYMKIIPLKLMNLQV